MRLPYVLCIVAACAFQPPEEQPLFNPSYAEWFGSVEQCAGVRGDFTRIRFLEADLQAQGLRGHQQGSTIWIDRGWIADRGVIQHEELHYLIGDPTHQSPAWKVCGIAPNH